MSVILATAGSNSSTSINYKLVQFTADCVEERPVECVELAGFDFPMYSEDLEKSSGIPQQIIEFRIRLQQAGGLLLSVNEHNGNPSAFFKNLLDWLSRDERRFLDGTPVFLMSASGGKRGAISSRNVVEQMLERFGAEVVSKFSLSGYYDNFTPEKGITDPDMAAEHLAALNTFLRSVSPKS
ncbi:MAG: NAD(P)H-dependent oxidoreductase [Robiginitalea sp.]|uniref:NADPH-dependent FMN reductase n=1 Tax=Robiginitalea sp. TaxID=1902411 RepID=UPI003C734BDA